MSKNLRETRQTTVLRDRPKISYAAMPLGAAHRHPLHRHRGASVHVFILCAMFSFRFCPRLWDFPDRKLAGIEPITATEITVDPRVPG